MAQEPRYTSHDDPFEARYTSNSDQFQFAEPVDLDESDSQFRSYPSSRSVATRESYRSDDTVPLFLSGYDEAPRPSAFGKPRSRAVTSRRLLKTSILAIAAAGSAFAVLSEKNPFTVFANATASLIGVSEVRSAAAPPAQAVQPAQPVAAVRASPPTTGQAPTRDEIALALKAAHQNLAPAEIREPAAAAVVIATAPVTATAPVAATAPVTAAPPVTATAPVVAAPPARRLAADELSTLMTRAKGLLAAGDIASARLLLERAADAQEPNAALMLAQTYDPAVLGRQDIRNITPDPALARIWYQRAAQLGSADAQRRLSQLQ
jgi:hypothetical protein